MGLNTVDATPRTAVDGLVVGESPRWHGGRLWFANWGAQEICTLDAQGTIAVVAKGPKPVGYSIDWLPNGDLLVTGEDQILRREGDGAFVTHVDLNALGQAWNEIVVDGRGNIYVNNVGFRFGQEQFRPGIIALVTSEGAVRQVADDIAFPNGMVVTPDNSTLIVAESFARRLTAFEISPDGSLSKRRVWASEIGADGICLDAEGAIWSPQIAAGSPEVVRVREGGEVLQRVALDAACFACMLGGADGKTLYMMAAEWRGVERLGELFRARTGRVLTLETQVPHAGWP
ncbi:MAG TPA: SMP-30/gluconolactonase/LRE family protein [Candidatus Acidoferrum sp.]|nr:SMP-30/gluconolactonase/LRE family protein [Candidatus Acidoferrum sp.]